MYLPKMYSLLIKYRLNKVEISQVGPAIKKGSMGSDMSVFTYQKSGQASLRPRRANDFAAMGCVIAVVVWFLHLHIASTTGAVLHLKYQTLYRFVTQQVKYTSIVTIIPTCDQPCQDI